MNRDRPRMKWHSRSLIPLLQNFTPDCARVVHNSPSVEQRPRYHSDSNDQDGLQCSWPCNIRCGVSLEETCCEIRSIGTIRCNETPTLRISTKQETWSGVNTYQVLIYTRCVPNTFSQASKPPSCGSSVGCAFSTSPLSIGPFSELVPSSPVFRPDD